MVTGLDAIRQTFDQEKQGHVFQWIEHLSEADRARFASDLQHIDVSELSKIYSVTAAQEAQISQGLVDHHVIPFPQVASLDSRTDSDSQRWESIGLDLIANGKAAILLLAGGQASRLGCSFPKGTYDIGLPSKKSLFQMQVERATKLQKIASERSGKNAPFIPWYIMTSPATYAQTVEHFERHSYFGLPKSNFFFFNQHVLPCITPEGKIINESAGKVALAPNGNGGLYKALYTSGALADMKKRGVEYVTQYCVDNVLIRVCDPVFLGFMHDQGADCAVKVAAKSYPEEPVGVLCLTNGKPAVIEYSEIDPSRRSAVDPETKKLLYNYGHICINSFSRDFLEKVAVQHLDALPYHVAKKKISRANAQGVTEVPDRENGWKLELFIFDTFQFSDKLVAFECRREHEFSPLKNGAGMAVPKDSPETCLADLNRMYAHFIRQAGATIGMDIPERGHINVPLVEISPLTSYNGEGLSQLAGQTFSSAPICL